MNSLKNSNNNSTQTDSQISMTSEDSRDSNIQAYYSNSLVIEPTIKRFLMNQNTNQATRISSILKKSSTSNSTSQYRYSSNNSRKDSFGVPILEGSKKHKIKFKSEIREVSIIENWKDCNIEEHENCSCTLI